MAALECQGVRGGGGNMSRHVNPYMNPAGICYWSVYVEYLCHSRYHVSIIDLLITAVKNYNFDK